MHVSFDDKEQWHALDLMIECKNSTAPWIGFMGHTGANGPHAAGTYLDPTCYMCNQMLRDLANYRGAARHVYAITEKKTGSGKDAAYEATQQVANATLHRYDKDSFDGHAETRYVSMVALPVVVTEAPLFVCGLDGKGDVVLEPVDRMTVLVSRLRLPGPLADGVEVLVVRASALGNILLELNAMTDTWAAGHGLGRLDT